MNRQIVKLAMLAILFGLAVGMLAPHLMKGEWREWMDAFNEKEPVITLPEGELKTDAFSVKLLQTALQTPEYPMDTVCPAAMTETLHTLNAISQGVTQEQIAALGLCEHEYESETSAVLACLDDVLPRAEKAQPMLQLPFRSNYPEAVSIFNTLFGYPAATSANTSPETRLFMAVRTELACLFRQPFYEKDAKNGDFDNADGGMPSVHLMRRCGMFRVAEAEDGSWKAVALLVKGNFGGDANASAFVAILPQGKVRDYALQLTPEQLSTIRRALAEAEPKECTVELPKLNLSVGVNDAAPVLRALGISAPFDIRTADFAPLTKETIALNAVAESAGCTMTEVENLPADRSSPDSSPESFSLTRPFLWFVGDLTTEAPFVVMGIVENL